MDKGPDRYISRKDILITKWGENVQLIREMEIKAMTNYLTYVRMTLSEK